MLLNQASLDMEYNFVTETQSGSNNETHLSFPIRVKQCAPHYPSASHYPSLPYIVLRFRIPTNVLKRTMYFV